MSIGDVRHDGWVTTESLAPRLDLWWSKLLPQQRAAALADRSSTMPEWAAQSLLRAGVPLSIDPGFGAGSKAGNFLVPPEFVEFIERKRAEAVPKKRFWQRGKS